MEDIPEFAEDRIIHFPIVKYIKGIKKIPDTRIDCVCSIVIDSLLKKRNVLVFSNSKNELAAYFAAWLVHRLQENTSLAMAYRLIMHIYSDTVNLFEQGVFQAQVQNPFSYTDFRNKVELPEKFQEYRNDYRPK